MSGADKHKFQGSVVHFIGFLYRAPKLKQPEEKIQSIWELFALTTYDGFRVVKPFADFHFPIQIASRLVDPTLSVSESKSLAGHTDSSSETYREGYSLQQNELDSLWKVFKSFQSHFKHSSSLYNPKYRLSAFVGKPADKNVLKRTVKIGMGRISIGGKLSFPQYEEILNHFSKIARGTPTYLDENKKLLEQEDSSFRYLENIQPVEKALVSKLNNALVYCVWHYYNRPHQGSPIAFVHKFYKDFYTSGEFYLRYKGQIVCWYCRPSLYEVIEMLRVWYGVDCTLDQFSARLEGTLLKFDRRGFLPLKEFFQGEIRHEGELFFRVDGRWLQVKADHMAVLQRSFHELLQDHLILKTARPLKTLKNKVKTNGLVDAHAALMQKIPAPDMNDPVNWQTTPYQLSSEHPYKASAKNTWEISIPDANEISVYFEKFQTEYRFDSVSLYDAEGALIQTITGKEDDTFSETIKGNYVKVVFESDKSQEHYGFDITKVAYR